MFLDRLRTAQPNSACVIESFDVTALYTNVSNDSATQAIFKLLTQHEGEINIWSGKYYAQIRGLAMGHRLAPSLAIAFMSKVEAPVTDLGPLLYCSVGLDEYGEAAKISRPTEAARILKNYGDDLYLQCTYTCIRVLDRRLVHASKKDKVRRHQPGQDEKTPPIQRRL
ncbi:unnamed protein product [Angiostrongylus costaricensis]|uniref:Reverse transcriptase domain-containing protein n=1 Tax=Angiostrongylus costaricensis TaxID=334426 RepID=A0A158PFG2_ANGCS|nr:unnamed protein product [Angiostrongylus costaricensis]